MDSESKVADLSEQTNHMSVVNAESVPLSKPIGKKAGTKDLEDVEEDDRDRKKRRKDSKDRDSRRSHRDRSSSRDRRRRDGDKDRERKDRDLSEKDKEKKESKDEDKEKTREREKDREKDRERGVRDRDRERDRDRDGRRDRDRERDRDRDRDRDRGRSTRDRDSRDRGDRRRRRSHSRSKTPPRRRGEGRDSRRRSRSPSSDTDRRKSRRRSVSKDKDSKENKKSSSSVKEDGETTYKQITLRDIIAANPGISVPEAVVRLNAYNTAVARGLVPDPITGPPQIPGLGSVAPAGMVAGMGVMPMSALTAANPLGSLGVLGDGGAATKPHRELYVGNLPPGITVPQLAEFINTAFKQLGLSKDPTVNTVVTAWVSPDGHYAFVEMRTVEEATAALTYLNGIQVGVFSLKIGRPKGYGTGGGAMGSALAVPMQGTLPMAMPLGGNPLLSAATGMLGSVPGLGVSNPLLAGLSSSMGGNDALSHVIMVTNLPSLISETQIKELFTPFGALKAFNVIKAGQTQSAVFEYVDSAITDGVVGGMNGLEIADHKLSVQRIPASSAAVLLQPSATVPAPPTTAPPAPATVPSQQQEPDELATQPPSTVIRMSNMTTPEDLSDDTLYEELLEDVADECNTHGTVKSLVIPRGLNGETDSSVGRIFVHFVDVQGAQASLRAVSGRKFNGRLVEAYFYPEELFVKKIYTLPRDYQQGGAGSVAAQNGHQQNQQQPHKSTDNINDIDEGGAPSASAEDAYDPTENLEDLD